MIIVIILVAVCVCCAVLGFAVYNNKDNKDTVTKGYTADEVRRWRTSDVNNWLTDIGLPQYHTKMTEKAIDGNDLIMLTREDIHDELGIHDKLHSQKLIRLIQEWQTEGNDSGPVIVAMADVSKPDEILLASEEEDLIIASDLTPGSDLSPGITPQEAPGDPTKGATYAEVDYTKGEGAEVDARYSVQFNNLMASSQKHKIEPDDHQESSDFGLYDSQNAIPRFSEGGTTGSNVTGSKSRSSNMPSRRPMTQIKSDSLYNEGNQTEGPGATTRQGADFRSEGPNHGEDDISLGAELDGAEFDIQSNPSISEKTSEPLPDLPLDGNSLRTGNVSELKRKGEF